jgi:azurin
MLKKLIGALALFTLANAAMAAKTCTLNVEANDAMQYNVKELKVAADCTEVEVVLKHTGRMDARTMGHNWVLTKTADFQPLTNTAVAAGFEAGYVPKNDKRVLAATPLIGGGKSTSVKFPVSKLTRGGDYTFFCSFPGHYALMKGKLTFG